MFLAFFLSVYLHEFTDQRSALLPSTLLGNFRFFKANRYCLAPGVANQQLLLVIGIVGGIFSFSFLFFFFFGLSRPAPLAYGSSQARGLIRVVVTSLRQSHSNARSEPHLRPTPQFMATLDP